MVVACSSVKAEYRALAIAKLEVIWLKYLLQDLCLILLFFRDIISAKQLTSNFVVHSRMKHDEIDWHFIRDQVDKKELDVWHTSSTNKLGNVFTKPLREQQFCSIWTKLMVFPPPSIWGRILDNVYELTLHLHTCDHSLEFAWFSYIWFVTATNKLSLYNGVFLPSLVQWNSVLFSTILYWSSK